MMFSLSLCSVKVDAFHLLRNIHQSGWSWETDPVWSLDLLLQEDPVSTWVSDMMPMTPTLNLPYLFPCQSWSVPQGPLVTRRSSLLMSMIWVYNVHNNSCSSSKGSNKNSSLSRGRWWWTGSGVNRSNSKWGACRGRWPQRPSLELCISEAWWHRSMPCTHTPALILTPAETTLYVPFK